MAAVDLAGGLSAADIEGIGHGSSSATVLAAGWERLRAAEGYLQRLVDERRLVYGVTTGYGPLATSRIDPSASRTLQRNLVYHLCSGVGDPLSRCHTRATLAARIASVTRGHSGVTPAVVERLLGWLEQDVIPEVPAIGTVGASGDLTPLAHVARALMGEGRVSVHGGAWEPADAAQRRLGWEPWTLDGKDAIALVNGTSTTAGISAVTGAGAERAAGICAVLGMLYAELLGGHAEAFQPAIGAARPHPGQMRAHAWLTALAEDSRRLQPWPGVPPRLDEEQGAVLPDQPLPQDPYSIRCLPQALGAVLDSITFHNQTVASELDAASDNPLLFPEEGRVLHGGNFFGQHLAFAADALNNALVQLAVHSERRINRITDPVRSGFPAFMQPRQTGLHSGFMGAQVTASALVAEMRTGAHPASIQSVPTNADNQDIVPMSTRAARQAATNLDHLQRILAIEALVLAQGLELTDRTGFSHSARQTLAWVRELAPPLEADRPLAEEIAAVADALATPHRAQRLVAGLPGAPPGPAS
ncbi:MAG: aromatic amino acid ammonia-lyase [Halorhodospira halophila]|uniref:HAL/PAL/TAL family ammonia-lyase n=1 Tax=Halorhodospira TaxID=85108 RepID=UPI001EE934BA|nr:MULTISPECIES: aromatic amino acid ammonia-lyase [Halorhodospira]MCC3749828.1 aromatic amino acid ammonia-lyase [Halorhodospira halophila]MCG5527748.1 aromatic amino acid ammonia-lyase [Halorhodospira halophila]MCG5542382.1 aromatic amino acid ammonia-lyase [Halorhodospira sp. 9628]